MDSDKNYNHGTDFFGKFPQDIAATESNTNADLLCTKVRSLFLNFKTVKY